MGRTFDTGFLRNVVAYDANGNVGLGGAVDATYKLKVTGAMQVTGAATFSSSVGIGGFSAASPSGADTILGVYGGQDCSLILQDAVQLWELYVNDDFYINRGSTNVLTALRSNGNVGIGTSSPTNLLTLVSSASGKGIDFVNYANLSQVIGQIDFNQTTDILAIYNKINGSITFGTNNTERMRITSGGNVQIGTTTSTTYRMDLQAGSNGGIWLKASNAGDAAYLSQGGIGYHFYTLNASSTTTFTVTNNGDVKNLNNSYGSLSDIKLKKEISPATPKLEDLLKVNVVNYKFINDEAENKQIGVIAQELEQIFPNMVSEEKQIGSDETYKAVKYSVFVPMLIKAIQEQTQIIKDLEARIAYLENK